ncbi:prolyl 4-hydroxylase subunit alpha-1 isoform X2 [Drosophila sechellia]|uniref:prolyl 4-hydroxylase subunit alpha-1 isoform X2 n=1 Tax=Drosophila sechellia TaxID=7238 RepID=UPI0013DE7456|nr:prolyl 4-hydroxylase subunit alpha-1 isoform X2 [Drosophila sechellia]
MLFWRLVLLGMLFLSLSFGQLRENDAQQRFSRSVVNMDDMLNLEDDLVSNVEKLAEALSRKAKTIKWGVFKMMKRRQEYKSSRELFANPIDTFSLIRHMQSDWLMWLKYLEMPVGQDAAEGIRKMQATYQMYSADIANGLLDGVQYNSSLKPIDCLAIGLHLMNNSRWYAAEQWIGASIEAYDQKSSQTEMELLRGPKMADLCRVLGQVQMKQRNHEGALQAYQVALKLSPHDPEIYEEYRILEKRDLTLSDIEPMEQDEDNSHERLVLPPCCSGRCAVPRNLNSLYCVYNHVTSPFLQLAPIKTEILSVDPFVVLLHDMISQKESTLIRNSSKEHMLPSATTDPDASDTETQVDTYRTSKSVWYSSDFNDTTKKITERLGDATGLDMNFTEFYQVINYGLGGFFETHLDMLLSEKNRFNGTRDRIATTLFYLNEVRQGGGTYFPRLNLTVFPQPGSALFWYNLDTKGNDHMDSLHTGCPVIVGSKWVMSKWINDMGQEFTRPCIDSSSSSKEVLSAERLII